MTPSKPHFALPAAAVSTALIVTACGGTDSAVSTKNSTPGPSPAVTGTPAAGQRNSADVNFAMMMIPHHAQAIAMSELILGKPGIDPTVTDLATGIKAAQGPEIEQMRGWLAGWGQPVPDRDGSMAGMPSAMSGGGMKGMMSGVPMAKIKAADGSEATRLFLTGMVEHHRGAIAMARTELANGVNPDARKLARTIIAAQQGEITRIKQLLAG